MTPPDGGDAGPGHDASDTADAVPTPEIPLTERASRGRYRCRIARDRTSYAPRSWGFYNPALVGISGGRAYLARREYTYDPSSPAPGARFVVGGVGVDGVLETPTEVPASEVDLVGAIAVAPRGDGFAMVWSEGERLRFAAFDATGTVAVAPQTLVDGLGEFGVEPRVAAGPDGAFGIVFDPEIATAKRAVHFMVVEASGGVRLAPRRLDPAEGGRTASYPEPTIVGGPDGYALLWSDDGKDGQGGIDFARADASGAETVGRRRVSVPSAFGTGAEGRALRGPELIRTASGYLAAWTEAHGPGVPDYQTGEGTGAWVIVQLARLDFSGVRQGAPVALRAPTDSVDEVGPSLVQFGDAVAVTWGRGKHIYLCGGCMPDHRLDHLLIDPADLTPLSEVVSLQKDPNIRGGGLVGRGVAVVGASLLITVNQTFHVHSFAASATITCDP